MTKEHEKNQPKSPIVPAKSKNDFLIMKNKRHDLILEIIREKDISTQEELQRELRNRGVEVTQATVSRDIRRLRLMKKQIPSGRSVYAVSASSRSQERERLLRVLRDSVMSVDSAQNIMVIKTESGMAMAAAAAIDSLAIAGIVGCIAGDDTIIAVLRTAEDAMQAARKLDHDLRLS